MIQATCSSLSINIIILANESIKGLQIEFPPFVEQ